MTNSRSDDDENHRSRPLPRVRYADFRFHVVWPYADRQRLPDRDEIPNEYFFELAPAFCSSMRHVPARRTAAGPTQCSTAICLLFEHLALHAMHFEAFAKAVMADILTGRRDPFVVELGSNDGIMLRHFHERGIRHLGVEPSMNVADVARSRGIHTISEFFDRQLADEIVANTVVPMSCSRPMSCATSRTCRGWRPARGVAETGRCLHLRRPLSRRHDRQDVLRPDLRRACLHLFGDFDRARLCAARSRARRRGAADHPWRLDALHPGDRREADRRCARRRATREGARAGPR